MDDSIHNCPTASGRSDGENDTRTVYTINTAGRDDIDDNVTEHATPAQRQATHDSDDEKLNKRALSLLMFAISFALCGFACHDIIVNQYLYSVFATGILGNASLQTTRDPCGSKNSNDSAWDQKVQQVQDKSANMYLYLNMASYGLGMVSNLFLGAYSHLLHRKAQILIPCVGYTIRCTMMLVVVYWELSIYWLFLGFGIDGLCGTFTGIYFATFLYSSDITSRNRKRTQGIAIIEGTKGLLSGGAKLLAGFLIDDNNFVLPSIVTIGFLLLGIILMTQLPNHKPDLKNFVNTKLSLKNGCRLMISPFIGNSKRAQRILILSMITFTTTIITTMGVVQVFNLYFMDFPFCWSSLTLGWYGFGRDLGYNLSTLLFVHVLYRWLPGFGLPILGTVLFMSSTILTALASTTLQAFMAIPLMFGIGLPITLIRGETSKLLGPEKQGPLFACYAVLESISFFAAPVVYLNLYKLSLHVYRGLEFFAAFGVLVFVLLAFVIQQVIYVRHTKRPYKSIKNECICSCEAVDGQNSVKIYDNRQVPCPMCSLSDEGARSIQQKSAK